jgi:hypothetical protein
VSLAIDWLLNLRTACILCPASLRPASDEPQALSALGMSIDVHLRPVAAATCVVAPHEKA